MDKTGDLRSVVEDVEIALPASKPLPVNETPCGTGTFWLRQQN